MLLAMEDYSMATKINPTKTEALFRHGIHYFNNKYKTIQYLVTECLKYRNAAMFLLKGIGSRRFTISPICWSESLWTRAPASCAASATSRWRTGTTHSSTILELFTLTRKTRKHSTTAVASCASKLPATKYYVGGVKSRDVTSCRIIFRLHPKKALQDFSISLLLDDSDDNVLAHLHRGILYNDIGKWVYKS